MSRKSGQHDTTVRIGLIVPATPGQFELEDLEKYVGDWLKVKIAWHPTTDKHALVELRKEGSEAILLAAAAKLITFRPQAVAYACTSISFAGGFNAALQQVAAIEQRVKAPVTSTSLAFVRAILALGNPPVAVAASYPLKVAEQFVRFLQEAGIRPVSLSVGDATTGAEANRFTSKEVSALVTRANCNEAGVVLVPDTAINTLEYLADLEDACGKPLLTANQVTVWDVLRVAGALRPIPRLGKLLTSPMVPPPNVSV